MQGVVEETRARHNAEVTEKAQRRRFSAEYKRRILAEADKCKKPGEMGALLRREGSRRGRRISGRGDNYAEAGGRGRLGIRGQRHRRFHGPVLRHWPHVFGRHLSLR